MHIQPKGNADWINPYVSKIKECTAFATEFNLDDVDESVIARHSQLPNNQNLTHYISPKKLKKLERILLKAVGLPLHHLMYTKPLIITNLLTEKILAEDNSVAMDRELFLIAKSLEKECLGIETFAEQIAILDKIPLDYQIKSLLKIGKNISQFHKQLKKMFAVYESRELSKIHKMAKRGIGELRKLMLYERNELMAERIFEKIQEKSIFCAIGAGHLGGKKGVIRLLKKKGLVLKSID